MKKRFYSSTKKKFPLSKHFTQYLKDKLGVVEVQRSILSKVGMGCRTQPVRCRKSSICQGLQDSR